MNTPRISAHALCLVLLAACPADLLNSETNGQATTTAGDPSTGESPTSGEAGTAEPATEPETTAAGSSSEGGIGDGQCDIWEQDCPSGYKCMAFAEADEPVFTGNRCTLVVDDPKGVGESCTVVDGWWSGIDDCDHGLACWDINHDTNEGQCNALCTGSPEASVCPDEADICTAWVPGIVHVCLTTCDPLIQDCNPGQACLPDWSTGSADEWVCVAEYSYEEGQTFDECAYINTCDPGHMCWDPSLAIECANKETGCCLPLCDLSDPQCTGQGAECKSFYNIIEGQAPPEFADVGLCVLPV